MNASAIIQWLVVGLLVPTLAFMLRWLIQHDRILAQLEERLKAGASSFESLRLRLDRLEDREREQLTRSSTRIRPYTPGGED